MTELTELQQFALEHKMFWWWVSDVTKLDEESIVEGTLTYGDMEDKKTLMNLMGKRAFASCFETLSKSRRAQNIEPRTLSYWSHYLAK
ncbi:MAG: hypothetical protein PHH70_00330 [Candidatus Gracilibacteria bacterium]|nr:hypothetical protein [Candidatus Gracilibacteria bacterium]